MKESLASPGPEQASAERTEPRWTSGTWSFSDGNLARITASGAGRARGEVQTIASVHRLGRMTGGLRARADEVTANGLLFAAAPDLAKALQALLVAVTYSTPPVDFSRPGEEPNFCFEVRVPVRFVADAHFALAKAMAGALAKTQTPDDIPGMPSNRAEMAGRG